MLRTHTVGLMEETLTTDFDTKQTADYSRLVVHFTKGKRPNMADLIVEGDPLFGFKTATALDRLKNILTTKTIYASPMPFLPNYSKAVSFTECIWDALSSLSDDYSSYGIVFSKRLIFDRGGGPALYLRGNIVKDLGNSIPASIEPFVAPFDPEEVLKPGVRLDFLHEREWRLPSSLTFEYSEIEYVIVNSIEDARSVVFQIGAERLPEKKLIPMEVYRSIKNTWGP
jgi:hypothetical protein